MPSLIDSTGIQLSVNVASYHKKEFKFRLLKKIGRRDLQECLRDCTYLGRDMIFATRM